MKNIKRTLITVLAMLLVCVLSVSATLAYLYAKTASVVNTFSVGNVEITLDEKDVDSDADTADNVTVNGETRDRANKYKLISGKTLTKDPTVHVSQFSEEAYIFVEVIVDNDVAAVLESTGENSIAYQMTQKGWVHLTGNIYYYNNTVTGLGKDKAEDLVIFESITVKSTATGEQLAAAADDDITITAYAIQADTIKVASKPHAENASAAWSAIQLEINK
jgi:predicted ribosomally synthesized peptide with SipW-like signal peptide